MNQPINVRRAALVRLLDAVLYPNPDDPGDPRSPWGPYGPIGPVISGLLRDLSWILLNPQPLPPRDIRLVISGALRDLSWIFLNPLPLPPRDIRLVISGALRDLSWILLNPQPLPPREIGALQQIFGHVRRSRVGVLLILVIISLSVWLPRRRTREETVSVPLEGDEEAVLLEDEEVVVPPGAPTPREEPMP